jgi:uncharacterized membrane protein
MNANTPTVKKSGGASPWIVIAFVLVALIAFGTGGAILGVLVVLGLVGYLVTRSSTPAPAAPAAPADLRSRVEFLERRVIELQDAVDKLRAGVRPAPEPAPKPKPAVTLPPTPRLTPPPPPRPAAARAPEPPRRAAARSFDWGRTVSAADLMGAKALAFAGGVVTLLGVIFFFVLAVNRGWIGPELRVACGSLASAIVFGAGLWLDRRYERTYSALAAVGVGIAGAYVTLLAAVSLYDLISKPVALVIAAAIATVGVAVSLAWSAEIVAGFGLIGAMIVPATLVFQGGLQEVGTAFVAIVFAGAAVVAVRERWWTMLQIAALVSVPQALAQVGQADTTGAGIVTLASSFWLLYLGAGIAFQLRLGRSLSARPATFLTGGAVYAGISAMLLFDHRHQGYAMLVVAGVYVAVAAALFKPRRELSTLVWALGLGLGAVGLGETFSGQSLTYAWAAEAALLAWLTGRVRDSRLQLPALLYLTLALGHALAVEANPRTFFQSAHHPGKGALPVLAVALAAVIFGLVKRSSEQAPSRGILRVLDPALRWLQTQERSIDAAAFSLAGLLAAYAISLVTLELFGFQTGHVVVSGLWSLGGLVAVGFALQLRSEITLGVAFAWLAVTAAKVVAFDTTTLSHTRYGISLALVGSAALLAGLARELSRREALSVEGASSIVVSLPLVLAGALVLAPDELIGTDGNGLMLVGIGALYTALAAATFKRRDLGTLFWILGLTVAGTGEALLLSGVWLVLAYAAGAAALAVVSVGVRERRLQAAALVYLICCAGLTLGVEAPPSDLVVAHAHPGHGLPSLILLIGALTTFAWSLGWNERHRLHATWVAVGLAVYGGSLAILEAAQWISPEGVHTDFQRGQTAVSAFWGILALVSLYAGLRRRRGLLRGVGFVLFAVSLGKIFLFDLPSLSSAQRALSFLAVGAVLLLGGFFYQRLSAQFDERAA